MAKQGNGALAKELLVIDRDFRAWMKGKKISGGSCPKLTPSRINRSKATMYPELHYKAAPTKTLLFFLAETFPAKVQNEDHIEMCLWGAAKFLHCMDVFDWHLNEAQAAEMAFAGEANQVSYLALARRASEQNEFMWALPPKFHAHTHIIDDVKTDMLNPKYWHCFADEDFVGHIGKLSAACHPSTQALETLIRYLAGVRLRWTT